MPDDLPPSYPARWAGDVVLSDGGTVHVRPIRSDDADALVAFHNRQSAESIYFRFFSSHPRLSAREVTYFTQVDHRDRVAFVAFLADDMIAVARYEPTGRPGTAEVAFFVDDHHHGRGLATVLLEYLVVAAREAGYVTLDRHRPAGQLGHADDVPQGGLRDHQQLGRRRGRRVDRPRTHRAGAGGHRRAGTSLRRPLGRPAAPARPRSR